MADSLVRLGRQYTDADIETYTSTAAWQPKRAVRIGTAVLGVDMAQLATDHGVPFLGATLEYAGTGGVARVQTGGIAKLEVGRGVLGSITQGDFVNGTADGLVMQAWDPLERPEGTYYLGQAMETVTPGQTIRVRLNK